MLGGAVLRIFGARTNERSLMYEFARCRRLRTRYRAATRCTLLNFKPHAKLQERRNLAHPLSPFRVGRGGAAVSIGSVVDDDDEMQVQTRSSPAPQPELPEYRTSY